MGVDRRGTAMPPGSILSLPISRDLSPILTPDSSETSATTVKFVEIEGLESEEPCKVLRISTTYYCE